MRTRDYDTSGMQPIGAAIFRDDNGIVPEYIEGTVYTNRVAIMEDGTVLPLDEDTYLAVERDIANGSAMTWHKE